MKGGNIIKIQGKNMKFSRNVICKFGNLISKGKYINGNTVICFVPKSKKPGKFRISISVQKGIFSGGNIYYKYLRQPLLLKIEPICGPIYGSTEIFIYGTNFLLGKKKKILLFLNNYLKIEK